MAIYRSVHTSFWTDTKVVDEFTPEDKYFMLYCLTNEYTNIIGCYEISKKQMENGTGYNKDTITRLIDRMQKTHKVLEYNEETKEMFISNWYKYNWTASPKLDSAILKDIEKVKCEKFKLDLIDLYNNRDTVSIPYEYSMYTTVTDTVSNTDGNSNIKEIINYLNSKLDTNYKTSTDINKKLINARLNDGFTVEQFKTVIDKKQADWKGTEFEKYLRPQTLFGTKFETYLNEKTFKQQEKFEPKRSFSK